MNTDAPSESELYWAERRVLGIQTKLHQWAIATVADRVVQASLKLVLEPIFEADFLPCSYGFRPKRRAHDAVAEVRHLTSRSFEWVVEGDIAACFDEISHQSLMGRVRKRVGDNRVLALVKAFLKAGILGEDRVLRATDAGTPQGSILSPLLSNVALSVLDEYIAQAPGGPRASHYQQKKRRRLGQPNYRLIRTRTTVCHERNWRLRCRRSRRGLRCCTGDGGMALRDRFAGGGPKSPQTASVNEPGW